MVCILLKLRIEYQMRRVHTVGAGLIQCLLSGGNLFMQPLQRLLRPHIVSKASANLGHFVQDRTKHLWSLLLIHNILMLWCWFKLVFCWEIPAVRRFGGDCIDMRKGNVLLIELLRLLHRRRLMLNIQLYRALVTRNLHLVAWNALERRILISLERIKIRLLPFLGVRWVHLFAWARSVLDGTLLTAVSQKILVESWLQLRYFELSSVDDAFGSLIQGCPDDLFILIQIGKLLKEAPPLVFKMLKAKADILLPQNFDFLLLIALVFVGGEFCDWWIGVIIVFARFNPIATLLISYHRFWQFKVVHAWLVQPWRLVHFILRLANELAAGTVR